ncbi:unnamed protein product [Psylliodes chrysocephalus]|uniref:Nuclear pore complex protein Nup88 n=1 Tax=Psylliodes chrysocephalus TaxID=3402493 RepID=A0A9P0CTD1_9CUCU|nr:unnamed protein product [Psylliodes chrysocephala]
MEVRQAKFHPGSQNQNHILVLTSDNMLRLYQIENNQSANIGIYSVGEKPTTFFPGSKTPFLDIYGEVAVDFDFGHPEIFDGSRKSPVIDNSFVLRSQNRNTDEKYMINVETQTVDKIVPKKLGKQTAEKDWNNLVWPVFILRSDMSVWKPILKGPLPMTAFENDQTEACSLICLNTVPQILCIALSNGTLCHSIFLDINQDSLTEMKENRRSLTELPDKELLAFERVELELGLATCEEDFDAIYKCPIFLQRDDSKSCRYYATHSAGVHSVVISCVDELQDFVNQPEGADPTPDIFSNLSKAEYLVCTKTAASEKSNPVIGFALYYEPTSIITLLSDGSLVSLCVLFSGCLPKLEDLIISDDTTITSPLKKMLQEPFEQYIQKILKKTSTQPVLKLPPSSVNSQEENYELLQRTAQVFREEYFKNHQKAREELEKRIQMLNMMKKNQQKELENMMRERDELQESASNLAEKSENLLMLVSRKKSAPSEAEKEFLKELNVSSQKIGVYGDKIDKIKSKLKYQQIQMENWKSQETKKISALNETHTNTIKTNIQETTKKITVMIKQVNEYRKQLHLK